MFKCVNTNEKDAVGIWRFHIPTTVYEIISTLNRSTVLDDTIPYCSKYGYKFEEKIYRLQYTSSETSIDLNFTYIETIYGQLVPKYLYQIYRLSTGKVRVYALDGILLAGPLLLRYPTTTNVSKSELVNLDIITSLTDFEECEEVDPDITLNYHPRISIIGKHSKIHEHKICCTKFAYTDGISKIWHTPTSKYLFNVPITIFNSYIFLPAPIDPDSLDDISIVFNSNDNRQFRINVTADYYDNYNNVIHVSSLLSTIKSSIFDTPVNPRITYKSLCTLSDLQLNPIFSTGRINNTGSINDHPIKMYLSIPTTHLSNMLFHVDGIDSLELPDYIRYKSFLGFIIYTRKIGLNAIPIDLYNKPIIMNESPERIFMSGETFMDGCRFDLSSVFLISLSHKKYTEIYNNCLRYTTEPSFMVDSFFRNMAYEYAPIGRFVIVEFTDDTGNVVKRII